MLYSRSKGILKSIRVSLVVDKTHQPLMLFYVLLCISICCNMHSMVLLYSLLHIRRLLVLELIVKVYLTLVILSLPLLFVHQKLEFKMLENIASEIDCSIAKWLGVYLTVLTYSFFCIGLLCAVASIWY